MTLIESIFLGLLQGFTEFLPVSSSGHLILAQKLFNINGNFFFDVMLHVGTLGAVVVCFRKSIWQVVRHPLSQKCLYIALASVPTFIVALVVKLFVSESLLNSLLPIGFALTIVLIVLSSTLGKPQARLDQCKVTAPLVVGLVQGIAVMPGLSRSGSTISVMKLMGINSGDSAEFSFLLSIPVIVASAVVELYEAMTTGIAIDWLCVGVGTLFAFLSGISAIYSVMQLVKKGNWLFFAVYLVIPLCLSIIFF